MKCRIFRFWDCVIAGSAVLLCSAALFAQEVPFGGAPATQPTTQAARGGRGQFGGPAVISPQVMPDRKVTFRVRAPEAKSVRLAAGDIQGPGSRAQLTKGDDGVWEATIGPVDPGVYRYNFNIDGVSVIDPRNPATSESNTNTWSVVVVPGLDFMDVKNVPHGAVAAVYYQSKALNRLRRMHIYTPPGYEKNQEKYPVFYLLHGAGDCDDSWTSEGRANFILDNLIAEHKARPMIVVMPAGHTSATGGGRGAGGRDEFSEDFVGDIMPYVESHYRVKTDRNSRAIAGLSMGGGQTMQIGFSHLDQFAYIGVFSSGVRGGGRGGAPAANNTWETQHQAMLDNAELKKGLKVLWFSTGVNDGVIANTRATVEMLQKHGFAPVFKESPGAHTWVNWRNYLNEFAPQLFTEEPGAAGGSRTGAAAQPAAPQEGGFRVTLQPPTNGTVKVEPELPADGKVAAGTVLTLTATPADGYVLDCTYYSGARGFNNEFPTPQIKITVTKNMSIGASFVEKSAVENLNVINNVVYAKPGVKELKYDVFSPKGAKNLPCVMIIHGGGWTSNCEDVMRGLGRQLAKDGKYVAISIDYRWIGTADGDAKPNRMCDLIEDCYGAILHIQEHAAEYGIDPMRLAVTGDSAGGHLSAAIINMTNMIGDGGFGVKPGVYEYKPTYIPKGKTIQQVRDEFTKAIKVAAPSYGVFSGPNLRRFANDGPDALKAISPIDNIPDVKQRAVPQFLTRGTNDPLIRDQAVQEYADALKAKGQTAEYVQVPDASHAFFDWKVDARTKATFMRFGVPYAAKMEEFFNKVFYP